MKKRNLLSRMYGERKLKKLISSSSDYDEWVKEHSFDELKQLSDEMLSYVPEYPEYAEIIKQHLLTLAESYQEWTEKLKKARDRIFGRVTTQDYREDKEVEPNLAVNNSDELEDEVVMELPLPRLNPNEPLRTHKVYKSEMEYHLRQRVDETRKKAAETLQKTKVVANDVEEMASELNKENAKSIKKFKANIGKVKNNGMKKESCPMVDVSDLKNKQNKLNGKISSDKKRLAIYRKFHRDFHKLFFLKGEFTTGGTILGFMSFGLLVGGLVVGSLGGAVAGLVLLGSATATMVYNGLISFDAFRIEDRLEESIRTKTAELEKIEQTLVGFENASTTVPQRNIKHEKTQNLAKKAAKRKVVTEESVLESEEDFNVDNPFSV